MYTAEQINHIHAPSYGEWSSHLATEEDRPWFDEMFEDSLYDNSDIAIRPHPVGVVEGGMVLSRVWSLNGERAVWQLTEDIPLLGKTTLFGFGIHPDFRGQNLRAKFAKMAFLGFKSEMTGEMSDYYTQFTKYSEVFYPQKVNPIGPDIVSGVKAFGVSQGTIINVIDYSDIFENIEAFDDNL